MNNETTKVEPVSTPWDRKLARLKAERDKVSNQRSALLQSQNAATERTHEVLRAARTTLAQTTARFDEIETELRIKRELLVAIKEAIHDLEAAKASQSELLTQAAAVAASAEDANNSARAPYTRHIAALGKDIERLDYRIEQHVARGPGATALFPGQPTIGGR